MPKVLLKGGTRSQLTTAASSSQLSAREVYVVTDENRLAVGTGTNSFVTMAKESEIGGSNTGEAISSFLLMGA